MVKPSLLPYEDEKEDFQPPSRFDTDDRTLVDNKSTSQATTPKELTLTVTSDTLATKETSRDISPNSLEAQHQLDTNSEVKESIQPPRSHDIVDWYGPDDVENPQNWPKAKKVMVTGLICLLTTSVYIGSAIYTPSIPGIKEHFDVSTTYATMGLSMCRNYNLHRERSFLILDGADVLAYGIGPMILSPLSEIPRLGRNPTYVATLGVFVVLQFPTAWAPNKETLMAMRFLSGFFASPALATGGATLGDMWPLFSMVSSSPKRRTYSS